MRKGEQTRLHIITQAAPVFNTHGYNRTSMAELTQATGLEKGGIYNHFSSKEALALAAFDYAVALVAARLDAALSEQPGALAQLTAAVAFFATYIEAPPLAGGCPILNTAIEADASDPALRDRAQAAMLDLQKRIGVIVKGGVARGELRADSNPRAVAAVITAALEGAIMIGRLYRDPLPMQHVIAHLTGYIAQLASVPEVG